MAIIPEPNAQNSSWQQSLTAAKLDVMFMIMNDPARHLSAFSQATLFISITLFLILHLGAAQSAVGSVEGVVTRAETAEPVSEVKVTLLGGPANPKAVRDLISALAGYGVIVTPPSPEQTAEGFVQAVNEAASARGISPVPYRGSVAAFL